MKRIITAIALLSMLLAGAPTFASNQDDPNVLIIPIGAIASGAAAVGTDTCRIPVPRGLKIVAAYVNTTSGITANATNSVAISLVDDGTAIATYNSATTAQTANVPVAMTVSEDKVAAGSVLGAIHVQSATGQNQALANVSLIIQYYNTDSQ